MGSRTAFKYRVWGAIGVVTLAAALLAGVNIRSASNVETDFLEFERRVLATERHMGTLRAAIQDTRRGEKDMILRFSNPDAAARARARFDKGIATALAAIDAARVTAGPQHGEQLGKIATDVAAYRDGMRPVIARVENKLVKSTADLDAEVTAIAELMRAIEPRIDDMLKQAQAASAEHAEEARGLMRRQRLTSMGLLALLVGFGWAGAAWLSRAVERPLRESVRAIEAVARGDLTVVIHTDRRDEFGDVLRALDAMVRQLRALVQKVTLGVDAVGTASAEIAQGNQDLSSRTEQQASSLQQTAASMEQLTSTVQHNADTASQASQLATVASDVAERGGSVVSQVVTRMGEISASSRKIEEIITVIDGIAFQTNILALNAAVEAARAGEQGRGFAVVAGEVRSLAQRSAQAAREIKSLIADSVTRVEAGSKLVDEAGETMTEIVAQVKRVTDLIGEITSATMEQSSGLGQVNQAVTQLDQMTQQNAALVEQSAAAAQSLNDQAAQLIGAVGVFKVPPAAIAAA